MRIKSLVYVRNILNCGTFVEVWSKDWWKCYKLAETLLYQAAGKFEVEDHSVGFMPKPDPTGEDGLIDTLTSGMNTLLWHFCVFFFADNMTGMVGTALYVSPEVQGNTKATYNQVKILVDLKITLDFKLLMFILHVFSVRKWTCLAWASSSLRCPIGPWPQGQSVFLSSASYVG